MKHDGKALGHASPELRSDRDVVLAAVSKHGLQFAACGPATENRRKSLTFKIFGHLLLTGSSCGPSFGICYSVIRISSNPVISTPASATFSNC